MAPILSACIVVPYIILSIVFGDQDIPLAHYLVSIFPPYALAYGGSMSCIITIPCS